MNPVELRNINMEPDEESSSGESAQDSYTRMGNSEKAAMSRVIKTYTQPAKHSTELPLNYFAARDICIHRWHQKKRKIPTKGPCASWGSLVLRQTTDFKSSGKFANEDAESQKFLTNGFLGEKKLAHYDDEHHPGTTTFGMSSFNLSNAIMGSGILGLSYAVANTGIILFVIMLLAVAILSLYSVHLLLKTAKEGGSLIYEKLGEKAFGWPGKIGAFVSITMQNLGAMSSYLFIIKYELPEVIRTFMGLEEDTGEWYLNGNYLVIFVSVGIILPLSLLKNLGYLGYTSGFSLTCMVFFVSVVIYKKFQIPCPLPVLDHNVGNLTFNNTLPMHIVTLPNNSESTGVNFMMDYTQRHPAGLEESKGPLRDSGVQYEAHTDDKCQPKYFVFNSRTAYAIPILAFAFVCHPEVLPIYSELKDRSRRKMQTVSNISITGMLIMYLLAALFGYLTFYGEVEDELLHAYIKVYTFDTPLLLVRLAVLVAVTLTVPIVLFPIRTSVTTLLFPKRPFSWIRHFLIAAIILALNNILVILVPTIKYIFGFIGASSATMLIFILPAAFYLRLVKKEPLRSPQKIGALIFLVIGIIFMIGSMALIIIDWIYNPPNSKHH
ncbi:sodium-coupled neutral amino acid transporter 4 isoform X2 [Dasypus novemcinctus]|uniref:sodium-coupled neutral amino acid transporter 4 isoform X2 n=1 Tax=Dasypus novemcinctus TaxID=9361 RepID=UPI00265DB9E6|nr:sodium-coupled neutral amino acid transporter 4 isoform X2 [Dasypus novemcinctus]